ncbi:hypothetical protein U9M48_001590 [Paspalum notatum var. saurae]|uniref:Uncharacterized protein n=1 Tax=Paspalum notatum var. saurae TaxID=547442 RepID=A0AAQ3SJ44_PASNO
MHAPAMCNLVLEKRSKSSSAGASAPGPSPPGHLALDRNIAAAAADLQIGAMAARNEPIVSDSNGTNLPAREFKEGHDELKIGQVDLAEMGCRHSDLGCLGIGSFQDLLMSASAGVLPVDINLSNPFFGSSLPTSNNPTGINCVAQPRELDDGYNGCDETDDNDIWGLDDPLEAANGESEDAVNADDGREDQEFDSATGSDFEDDGNLSSGSESDDVEVEEITIDVDVQQEIYVDEAQVGVPYRKRKRVSSADKKLNHRKPRCIGAVERALRGSSTRKTEHIFEPVVGMVFDSREEAREFYNMYSWEVGFGIKYCNSR